MSLQFYKKSYNHLSDSESQFIALQFLAITFFIALFLNHAWLSDDSFITMRTVLRFVGGQGLTWNLGERVQVFTHPLWFFTISLGYFLSRSLYYSTLMISAILSLVAVVLLVRQAEDITGLILAVTILFSRSFIDYTSSGLENPLSYALFAIFLIYHFRNNFNYIYGLLAALIFLTRMDFAVILLPMCVYALWMHKWNARIFIPGALLVLAWLSFSTFYFGFPFPNTFLAKMSTNFSYSEYFQRFLNYLIYSLNNDPVTIVQICIGMAFVCCRKYSYATVGLGLILYSVYLARIGGDFMGGRFFSVPAFISVFIMSSYFRHESKNLIKSIILALLFVPIFINVNHLPVHNDSNYHNSEFTNGIADERGYYFQRYGLIAPNRRWPEPKSGTGVINHSGGGSGRVGIQNMDVYLVDWHALGSPYLSRLKPIETKNWQIGHLRREIPLMFEDFILDTPVSSCIDALKLEYFNDIRLIATGPLVSVERLGAIYRVNFPSRRIRSSLNAPPTREELRCMVEMIPPDKTVLLPDMPTAKRGDSWLTGVIIHHRLDVVIEPAKRPRSVRILLDNNDVYDVIIHSNHLELYRAGKRRGMGLQPFVMNRHSSEPIHKISIFPRAGDGKYSVGTVTLR